MDKYQLQAIENTLSVIYSLEIIICSALFSWWLLLLLFIWKVDRYVKEEKKDVN